MIALIIALLALFLALRLVVIMVFPGLCQSFPSFDFNVLNGDSILGQMFEPIRYYYSSAEPTETMKQLRTAKVVFNWNGTPRIGSVMTFTITYFKGDGTPYPISAEDRTSVEIRHIEKPADGDPTGYQAHTKIDFSTETCQNEENSQLVKFSVRRAGEYRIRVKIGHEDVPESPFTRMFVPGLPDPDQSVLIRGTHAKLFVIGQQQKITIEIRDCHGNLCRGQDIDLNLIELAVHHVDVNEPSRPCQAYLNQKEVAFVGKIILTLEFNQTGILHGEVKYDGRTVRNSTFDLVVLNYVEAKMVDDYWNSNRPVRTYAFEAELYQEIPAETVEKDANGNPRNSDIAVLMRPGAKSPGVWMRKCRANALLSPKNLTISRKFWKFFNKKVATLRITVHTRFRMIRVNPVTDVAIFNFSDALSPSITLSMPTTCLRVFMAIFTKQLARKLGETGSLNEKAKYFYGLLKQGKEYLHHSGHEMEIDRRDIIASARTATRNFCTNDWFRVFRITFMDEPAIDGGGVRREFFELLTTGLFENNRQGMFCSIGQSRLVHPNPFRNPKWKGKTYERIWEMAGRVVGKCLFECAIGGSYKLVVKARFSRSFLSQILGLRPHYKHFEQDDPELYLGKVKHILENDVKPLRLTFTDEEYSSSGALLKVVELVPNGANITVDEDNKVTYLHALAHYRLCTRVRTEIDFFVKGLNSLVPDDLLNMFDENELEILMCGKSTYSMEELKMHHRVLLDAFFIETGSKILDWFFTSVMTMNSETKAKLLQFTTGCSLLPPGGLRRLVPPFTIQPLDMEELGMFPTAHTCANLLCLYDHGTFESFEKALLLAITEGCEGFAMV